MVLQDSKGQRYISVRKFGESRLPAGDCVEHEFHASLAQHFLADGKLLVPAGNGKFRVEDTGETLTVVAS